MTKANRELVKRMKPTRALLKEFGATLFGFDPGVAAYLPGRTKDSWGDSLTFDGIEWSWLEPLLVELREARKSKSRTS